MVTRKELVKRLQEMNLDEVLFSGERRSVQWAGRAAQVALEKLLPGLSFGQSNYCTKRGLLKNNPKWFTQMYVNIAWATGNVTPGSILQALH
jgi:hypothetical protein